MSRLIKVRYIISALCLICTGAVAQGNPACPDKTGDFSPIFSAAESINFKTLDEINRDIKGNKEIALRLYKESKGNEELFLFDLDKTYAELEKQKPELAKKITKQKLKEKLIALEQPIVLDISKGIFDNFFSSTLIDVKPAIEAVSPDLKFFEKRYSEQSIRAWKSIPYLIVRDPSYTAGGATESLGGASISFEDIPNAYPEFLSLKINIELEDGKFEMGTFIRGKKLGELLRDIQTEVFGSSQIVIIAEKHLNPSNNPIVENNRQWAFAEETAHALDNIEFPHLRKIDIRNEEKKYLQAIVMKNRDGWFERDLKGVQAHPQFSDYVKYLIEFDEEATETVEEMTAKVPEILLEDYPRDYGKFWPYLHSEVEMRAKWQATQYLRHVKKLSLKDLFKLHAYWRAFDGDSDREVEEFSILADKMYFVILPETFQKYYQALYEANDKPPLHLNPFAVAWEKLRKEGITSPEAIFQRLEGVLKE